MRNKLLLGLTMGFLATTAVMVGNSVVMAGDDELDMASVSKPLTKPAPKPITAEEGGSGDGDDLDMESSPKPAKAAAKKEEPLGPPSVKGKTSGDDHMPVLEDGVARDEVPEVPEGKEEGGDKDDGGYVSESHARSRSGSFVADHPHDEETELDMDAPAKPKIPKINPLESEVNRLQSELEAALRDRDSVRLLVRERETTIQQRDQALAQQLELLTIAQQAQRRLTDEGKQLVQEKEVLRGERDQAARALNWITAYTVEQLLIPISKYKLEEGDAEHWFKKVQLMGALSGAAFQHVRGDQLHVPQIAAYKAPQLLAKVRQFNPEEGKASSSAPRSVSQRSEGPSISSRDVSSRTTPPQSSVRGSDRAVRGGGGSSSSQPQQPQSRVSHPEEVVDSGSRSSVSQPLVRGGGGRQPQSHVVSSPLVVEGSSGPRSSVPVSQPLVRGGGRQPQQSPYQYAGGGEEIDSSLSSASGSGVGGGGLGGSSSSVSRVSAPPSQPQPQARSMARTMGRTVTPQEKTPAS